MMLEMLVKFSYVKKKLLKILDLRIQSVYISVHLF